MQGVYGGLVVVIAYATNEPVIDDSFSLITQDNLFIYTQTLQEIQVQE